ncbi:FHA domain-containing protein [Clostridium thermarum]|uniref:FHA domain-containing protein n=1 Tax=Clostridium thermarum TaxID=1716543 RepID=UPI0011237FCD|nr:FHA domain-containing protein [Clostridium thermarum]
MIDYASIFRPIFIILFILIIYIIIFMALRIMYKDVKNGDKKKILKKSWGLEVIAAPENSNLGKGSIIPINRLITIGRKEDNMVILNDPYASGYHAKVYVRNTDYYLEDLNSTNGTLLNEEKVEGKVMLEPGDEIRIGTTLFKVIG